VFGPIRARVDASALNYPLCLLALGLLALGLPELSLPVLVLWMPVLRLLGLRSRVCCNRVRGR